MIDTHCHLYSTDLLGDIDKIIKNAWAANVLKFYLPAIDSTHTLNMQKVTTKYPECCFAMAGLHPCSVKQNFMEELTHVKHILATQKIYGIGETGLDFYWDKSYINQQYEALEIQIELALAHNLPLILHTRDAMQQTIDVVKKYKNTNLRGIFHCFTGSYEQAKEIIDTGFYLGIGGVITYKNAGIADVISKINLAHIVLETDAPYLTPVPYRGKLNESSYLKYIAEKIATLKNCSVAEVDVVTTNNAEIIFGI